jgi:RNA polymerase sigma-70 factor (ECF subfamily)
VTAQPEPGATSSAPALAPRLASLFTTLYEQSGAAQFGIAAERFTTMLLAIGARYLPVDGSGVDPVEFYSSLHVAEFILARACADGNERAWEIFLARFRARLYEMAGAIARDDSTARELADSLYAELYGLETRGGQRASKLRYYLGRGSLEGWLRTVLAQQFVNRCRAQRPAVSLEESEEGGAQFAAPASEPAAVADPRLTPAIDAVLTALPAEERFLLASYYLDGRTLAQVARLLGVHESTISRRLERLVRTLRRAILKNLVATGMSQRAAQETIETDVRDLAVDVRGHLAAKPPPAGRPPALSVQEPPSAPFPEQDTS